ncbi:hypothetical protein C0J52_28370 [Blattella germanica]|nr:hypothetical protein C0J52_28370 [Blattella germanica]
MRNVLLGQYDDLQVDYTNCTIESTFIIVIVCKIYIANSLWLVQLVSFTLYFIL